jgi:hypothetical protein
MGQWHRRLEHPEKRKHTWFNIGRNDILGVMGWRKQV